MNRRKTYNGKATQLPQLATGDSEPFHFASTSTDGSSKGTKGVKRKRTTVNVVMVKENEVNNEEDKDEGKDHSKYDPYKRIPMENQWPVKQFLYKYKKLRKKDGTPDWHLKTQFENGVARLEDMNFGQDVDLTKVPTVEPEEFKKKGLVPVYKKQPTVYATPFCFYCQPRCRRFKTVYALRKHVIKKHFEMFEKYKNGIWRDHRKDKRTPENVGGRPKNSRNKNSKKIAHANSASNDSTLNEPNVNHQHLEDESSNEDEDDQYDDNESDEDDTEDEYDTEVDENEEQDETEDDDENENEEDAEEEDIAEKEFVNKNIDNVEQREREEEDPERTITYHAFEKEPNNQEMLKNSTHPVGQSNIVEKEGVKTNDHDGANDDADADDNDSNRDSLKENDTNSINSSVSNGNFSSVIKRFQSQFEINDLEELEENNSNLSPD